MDLKEEVWMQAEQIGKTIMWEGRELTILEWQWGGISTHPTMKPFDAASCSGTGCDGVMGSNCTDVDPFDEGWPFPDTSNGRWFTLQRWATKQGGWMGGDWFVGDFNGDGKDDLAYLFNDAGNISVDVHASTGTAFTFQRWATQQGGLLSGMEFFIGDFDGDGRDDLAAVFPDDGQISVDVHKSTGTAFTLQRWATKQGGWMGGDWFVGDFNGDGKDDLAYLFNDAGNISVDVHASTGTAFTFQRWATQQGQLLSGMEFFIGDFDGDGRDDVAAIFDDYGWISIDVHASTGTAFTLQRWATKQGGWVGGDWFVGDFSGDGKDDLADLFNDAGNISIDVFVAHVIDFVYLPMIMRQQ